MAKKKTANKKTSDAAVEAPPQETAGPDDRTPEQRFKDDYPNKLELRQLFFLKGDGVFVRTGLSREQDQAARAVRKEYGL